MPLLHIHVLIRSLIDSLNNNVLLVLFCVNLLSMCVAVNRHAGSSEIR